MANSLGVNVMPPEQAVPLAKAAREILEIDKVQHKNYMKSWVAVQMYCGEIASKFTKSFSHGSNLLSILK